MIVRTRSGFHSLQARLVVVLGILLLSAAAAGAQIRTAPAELIGHGQAPPGIRWKKIDTPNFEVVFPAELEADGQRVANTLEHLYAPVAKTLHVEPKRTTVILANQTTVANGFVTLAPRMSQWNSTPPADGLIGTGEWFNLLAVHEFRHVAQFDKTNSGFVRALGTVFGEVGTMLGGFLAMPTWWWEGDAVGIETALSLSGRGRQPSFDLFIRTRLLSDVEQSYATASLGTYNDIPATPYDLGYLLTSYVKLQYGADAWSRIVQRAARDAYRPLAFTSAVRAVTGRDASTLHREAMAWYRERWEAQLEGLRFTEARQLTPAQPSTWTSYFYPQYTADGAIVAQKFALDAPQSFVRIRADGREEHLQELFPTLQTPVRVGGSLLAWTETRPDRRWGQRDYSVVRTLGLTDGRARTLTRHSKLFNPAPSPDGRRIAAVEYTPAREASIVVLDARSGQELRRYASPDNDFISGLSWSADGRRLAFTRQGMNGKAITLLDPESGAFRDVLPHSFEDVDRPVVHGRYLYHNSAYSGIDNIYAVDLETGTRYQVTSRRFGAFDPAVSADGRRLLFSDYTVRGHAIAEMQLDPQSWTPLAQIEDRSLRLYDALAEQESGGDVLGTVPNHRYEVKDYRQLGNLFELHSWALLPGDDGWSVELLSNNKMNTMAARLGYGFHPNERTSAIEAAITYGGWYPLLDLQASTGSRSTRVERSDGPAARDRWRETSIGGGVRLPWNLSRGPAIQALQLGIHASRTEVREREHADAFENGNGVFFPVTYSLDISRFSGFILAGAMVGRVQSLTASYRHTPFDGDYEGAALALQGQLALAGIRKTHGLVLRGGFEEQRAENYRFESVLRFPRGHAYSFQDRFAKASVDYVFPVANPDFNLGEWLHVPRLKSSLFYDHAEGRSDGTVRQFRSAGVELTAVTNPFSLPIYLDVGTRYVHRLNGEGGRFEFIIGF
jgi:hypothetical protein